MDCRVRNPLQEPGDQRRIADGLPDVKGPEMSDYAASEERYRKRQIDSECAGAIAIVDSLLGSAFAFKSLVCSRGAQINRPLRATS